MDKNLDVTNSPVASVIMAILLSFSKISFLAAASKPPTLHAGGARTQLLRRLMHFNTDRVAEDLWIGMHHGDELSN